MKNTGSAGGTEAARRFFDAVIIGAGASGLYCAMTAAKAGVRVAVVDMGSKPARKVLVAGGGRCNVTNLATGPEHYLSSNPHFCKSALARHTPWDVLDFLSSRKIATVEKAEGQLFSADGSLAVARALEDSCREAGVSFLMETEVRALDSADEGYRLRTSTGVIEARKVVVATGGVSWPKLGVSPLGYDIARKFGLGLVPVRPGLVPFSLGRGKGWRFSELSGLSLPVRVESGSVSFCDSLLFTHRGISGPAVLQLSSFWRQGEAVSIDLLPGSTIAEIIESAGSGRAKVINVFSRVLPKRVASVLFSDSLGQAEVGQLSKHNIEELRRRLHRWEMVPQGTEGWPKAEVTVGGVDTDAISSKTMEVRKVPGLYFIGEVLDVTGQLGGFNLQWAWSSGFVCGCALGD